MKDNLKKEVCPIEERETIQEPLSSNGTVQNRRGHNRTGHNGFLGWFNFSTEEESEEGFEYRNTRTQSLTRTQRNSQRSQGDVSLQVTAPVSIMRATTTGTTSPSSWPTREMELQNKKDSVIIERNSLNCTSTNGIEHVHFV